jgi:hypothetical protein
LHDVVGQAIERRTFEHRQSRRHGGGVGGWRRRRGRRCVLPASGSCGRAQVLRTRCDRFAGVRGRRSSLPPDDRRRLVRRKTRR